MPSRAKKARFLAAASEEPVCKWGKLTSENHMETYATQTLLGAAPIRLKQTHRRFAAWLLFASAAVICSLSVWASPPSEQTVPDGNAGNCGGAFLSNVPYPFPDYYSCIDLGSVPG